MIGYLGAALGFGGAVLAEEAVAALAEEVGCGFLAEAALRVLIFRGRDCERKPA